MGQLVSGYLDFAERQAEREQVMTMKDWAKHLDRILTMSGEQLLQGNGNISHMIANMGKGKHISMETLTKICETLDCEIADVIELVKDYYVAKSRKNSDRH